MLGHKFFPLSARLIKQNYLSLPPPAGADLLVPESSQNPDRTAVRRRRPEVPDDGDRRRHEGRLDEVRRPLRARDLVAHAEELRREALGDGADLAPLLFRGRRHEQRW